MIRGLFIALICSFSLVGFGQEMLVELNSNPLLGAWQEAEREHISNGRALGDTLDLPFFDDFSEPFSRLHHPHDLYPSLDRWQGKTTYVNNHMPINPISQGVVTFDGLDENGLAYGFGFTTPTLSDSLTSKPLNLLGATDSVYLSFYYQAQGMGNAPEDDDILTVEFKDTADIWHRVWEANGYILEDYKFQRTMLPITDLKFLYNGFQFRFLNYASRAGSVDHWHVDYVKLDEGRSLGDTLINDVSYMAQTSYSDGGELVSLTSSLLKNYSSMPWSHFVETSDSNEYMLDTLHIELRNNFDEDKQLRFIYKVRDESLAEVYAYESISGIAVFANSVCGSKLNDCNDDPFSNFRTSTNNFFFPHSTADSAYFLVEYIIDTINDAVSENDKSVFKQAFYNYYAYDDGTAELAYGLGNLENEGMVGVKYEIKKADSLRAIQIYLNPVNIDISTEPVKLMIWSGNSEPGGVIYESSEFLTLSYSDGINYFYNYDLENAVWVEPGNIWVGWTQQPATGVIFSVGFDKRTDHSEYVFYNLGTTWNQSTIPGTVMIRPVFGPDYDWVSGVDEVQREPIHIYPNPTNGQLFLQESFTGELSNADISVFDITGRMVLAQKNSGNALNLDHLRSGTYIVRVQTERGRSLSKRIVLQP